MSALPLLCVTFYESLFSTQSCLKLLVVHKAAELMQLISDKKGEMLAIYDYRLNDAISGSALQKALMKRLTSEDEWQMNKGSYSI